MPNVVKQRMMEELRRTTAKPSSFLFVGYQGLTVAEATNLRAALAEWNVGMRVVKNTVASRAFRERGLEADPFLRGPTAVIASDEDGAIAAARVLVGAKKKFPRLELRGGFLEGRRFEAVAVPSLAAVPTREVLLAQTLGALLGPASALPTLFAASLAVPARLAAALAAKRETGEAGAPSA